MQTIKGNKIKSKEKIMTIERIVENEREIAKQMQNLDKFTPYTVMGKKAKYMITVRKDVAKLFDDLCFKAFKKTTQTFLEAQVNFLDSHGDETLIERCQTIGNSYLVTLRHLSGGKWTGEEAIIMIEGDGK
jgi:hypothetical protein